MKTRWRADESALTRTPEVVTVAESEHAWWLLLPAPSFRLGCARATGAHPHGSVAARKLGTWMEATARGELSATRASIDPRLAHLGFVAARRHPMDLASMGRAVRAAAPQAVATNAVGPLADASEWIDAAGRQVGVVAMDRQIRMMLLRQELIGNPRYAHHYRWAAELLDALGGGTAGHQRGLYRTQYIETRRGLKGI